MAWGSVISAWGGMQVCMADPQLLQLFLLPRYGRIVLPARVKSGLAMGLELALES